MTAAATRLLSGFPFPFPKDQYRYSTNVEPAGRAVATAAGEWGGFLVDVDEEYCRELGERAAVLAADPSRHAVLAHMRPAAWDALVTVLGELALARPDSMRLVSLGEDRWRWENDLLGVVQEFRYGDEATLPEEPLRYLATQAQEDVVLLDQREGQLFVDAGVVTFAADWSFGFDVGMSFLEIHGPVPRIRAEGVITRAQEFLLRLQPHQPHRRTNWTMTIGRRLDVSTERYPQWGPDREAALRMEDAEFGRLVHLRVEVQHLVRLADSGALMFLIRTYLLPLEELAAVEPWRARAAEVLAELPEDMASYKGIAKYRARAAEWLRAAAPDDREPAPCVDPAGAAFLIVAVGADARTAQVAGGWVGEASAIGPTRLVTLDTLASAQDRETLARELARTVVGTRICLVGGQYDVLVAQSLCRAAGAIDSELTMSFSHTRDLPVFCAHCRDEYRVTGRPGGLARCPGCARLLQIHDHRSALRGSFLASGAEERELA